MFNIQQHTYEHIPPPPSLFQLLFCILITPICTNWAACYSVLLPFVWLVVELVAGHLPVMEGWVVELRVRRSGKWAHKIPPLFSGLYILLLQKIGKRKCSTQAATFKNSQDPHRLRVYRARLSGHKGWNDTTTIQTGHSAHTHAVCCIRWDSLSDMVSGHRFLLKIFHHYHRN